MRTRFLSIGALIACGPAQPQAIVPPPVPQARPPIFREIDLGRHGRVALDAPLSQRGTPVAVPLSRGVYALVTEPGWSFADTDYILVTIDAAERVKALRFVYQPGKDFAAAADEYEAALGPPGERGHDDSAGTRIERVTWQDAQTRFELRRVLPPVGGARVSSVLASRRSGP